MLAVAFAFFPLAPSNTITWPSTADAGPSTNVPRSFATAFAQLKRFGSPWPDEALFDLAIYAYYLDSVTWRYWTVAQARLPQGVDRLIETVIALLAPALEGGEPPPPPYAPRRAFSRS